MSRSELGQMNLHWQVPKPERYFQAAGVTCCRRSFGGTSVMRCICS
jgi:hypothetical protein